MQRAEQISNRGYNLIEFFGAQGSKYVMPEKTARQFDQRTTGGLARRKNAILERHGGGIRLSQHGWEVRVAFHDTNIMRKDPTLDLSVWLSNFFFSEPERKKKGAKGKAKKYFTAA